MKKHPWKRWSLCILIIILLFIASRARHTNQTVPSSPRKHTPLIQRPQVLKKPVAIEQTSVFVPSWQLSPAPLTLADPAQASRPIDEAIYFAVSPDEEGTLADDAGFDSFLKANSHPALLTIKMTNESTNTRILRNSELQDRLITQALSMAEAGDFAGILLDFEHSVLPFKEVRTSITSFVERFSQATHAHHTSFAMTLYGDTYHRGRPYDVADLEPHVDMVYIMAYDFHKAFGEPGPNFPLTCGSKYPYCFTHMLDDFTADIPAHKITLVYGLYGYTWNVDSSHRPATSAKARTYAQLKNTPATVDPISAESTYAYTENERTMITWFETPASIRKKTDYARTRGISHFAYWAYGYY